MSNFVTIDAFFHVPVDSSKQLQILQFDKLNDAENDSSFKSQSALGAFVGAIQRSAWISVPLLGAAAVVSLIVARLIIPSLGLCALQIQIFYSELMFQAKPKHG